MKYSEEYKVKTIKFGLNLDEETFYISLFGEQKHEIIDYGAFKEFHREINEIMEKFKELVKGEKTE